eukprot:TRINITY_DN39833_c0_g1_i1.p1 TRINITY_DN39833_c0_g1~~TRINITY_DN39833_c0_g1_i1.p1  ORF type:complete len:123 (-),score=30.59 TRINITY_DN39833_c0_g1_i1:93-461(-)
MLRSLVGSEMCIRDSNKEMQCVWCSYVSGPSPKTLCTVCGDESSYVRCTTCAKYSSSHKWVCTCMSIIPTTITSCEICDGPMDKACLLYTSDAADEEDSVDLGGRRIIKKKKEEEGNRDSMS